MTEEQSIPPGTPIDPPPPVITETVTQKPKKDLTNYLIIGAIILLVIVVLGSLVIGFSLLKKPKPTAPKVKPPVTQAPPETPANPTPSKYASDSGLLKIRDDLQFLGTQIDSVDLFEPQLSPPNLDLNIHIK